MNKQIKTLLLVIGITAPILFYLVYMLKFGVDVPFMDEWDGIPLIRGVL